MLSPSKWIKEGNSLIKREDKKIPSLTILQDEHFHLLHQAFRRVRGLGFFPSATFRIGALPSANAERGSSQERAPFAAVPPPGVAWGLGPRCGPRSGLPALLWLLLSSPRVLRSRDPLNRPEHPGCLFWTQATKRQNRAWMMTHLPRLAPLQQSIRATAAPCPVCSPQGSGDSGEDLQPSLYHEPPSQREPRAFWRLLNPFNLQWLRKGLPIAEEPPAQDGLVSMLQHTQMHSGVRRRQIVFSLYRCKCIVRLWGRRVTRFLIEISLIIN